MEDWSSSEGKYCTFLKPVPASSLAIVDFLTVKFSSFSECSLGGVAGTEDNLVHEGVHEGGNSSDIDLGESL